MGHAHRICACRHSCRCYRPAVGPSADQSWCARQVQQRSKHCLLGSANTVYGPTRICGGRRLAIRRQGCRAYGPGSRNLGDLMRDAALFPDPGRTELRNELREYGQAVINEEWPAMASGESSAHVWDVLNRLFESFSRLKPAAPWE